VVVAGIVAGLSVVVVAARGVMILIALIVVVILSEGHAAAQRECESGNRQSTKNRFHGDLLKT
jgi:hypothetical protein